VTKKQCKDCVWYSKKKCVLENLHECFPNSAHMCPDFFAVWMLPNDEYADES